MNRLLTHAGLATGDMPLNLRGKYEPMAVLIKSVSCLGRIGAFTRTIRDLCPILLLRNPFFYTASRLRGVRNGWMSLPINLNALALTPSAAQLGACEDIVHCQSPVERIAWEWLIGNLEAITAIRGSSGFIVSYDSLVRDPLQGFEEIFQRLDIPFSNQTINFLSKAGSKRGAYFSIFRNGAQLAKEHPGLSASEAEAVGRILARSKLGEHIAGLHAHRQSVIWEPFP